MFVGLQEIERKGLLSDAQLETIVYANMRFKTTVDGGGTFPILCYNPTTPVM